MDTAEDFSELPHMDRHKIYDRFTIIWLIASSKVKITWYTNWANWNFVVSQLHWLGWDFKALYRNELTCFLSIQWIYSNYSSKNFCSFPKTLIFLLFQGFMTCVYLCIGNVYKLMNYMAFVEGIFFGFTITGLIILRITRPKMKRPIKVSFFFFL